MRRECAVVAAVFLAAMGVGMLARGQIGVAPAVPAVDETELVKQREVLYGAEAPVTVEMLKAIARLDARLHPPGRGGSVIIMSPMMEMPGYGEALEKYAEDLAFTLGTKNAEARGECVKTLLLTYTSYSGASRAQIRPYVPAVFGQLAHEQMVGVLKRNWLSARSPKLLPVLLKIYDELPDEVVQSGRYGSSELRDALLLRAYELDPEQVRPRVLAAIKNPGQRFSELWVQSLMALPDKELPEMDDAFREAVSAPRGVPTWVYAKLVARYGTAAIEPEVKRYYEVAPGRWACTLQASMLAYFLRVDPKYGVEALTQALKSRQTGCWRTLISDVAAQYWSPELEKCAIDALAQHEAEIPVSAAGALKRWGSPEAKTALMDALKANYHGVAGTQPLGYKDPDAARRRTIVTALLDGHGWVLSATELAEVTANAGDEGLVKLCRERGAQTALAVTLVLPESGQAGLRLDGESYATLRDLMRKIRLYPAGTRIKVTGNRYDDMPYSEFRALVERAGLTIE